MIKKEAYLWRASPEMSTVGDALHLSIAWPTQKIDIINQSPYRVSPLSSSPQVNFWNIQIDGLEL